MRKHLLSLLKWNLASILLIAACLLNATALPSVQVDARGASCPSLSMPNAREQRSFVLAPSTGRGAPTGQVRLQEPGGQCLGVLIVGMDPGIDHERARRVLDAARAVGARWIRVGFIWELANPEKDTYDFAEFDWIIGQAVARDLRVLPVVMFTPSWASSRPNAQEYYLFPPTDARIGSLASPLGTSGTGYDYLYGFARTVASRYGDCIDHWELWNEPDMNESLKDADGDGSSAGEYARMLAYFYRGIKDGNPGARVLSGGLADDPREPGCDADFLHEILTDEKYPALGNFDILNIHTNFRGPEEILAQIERNRDALDNAGGGDKRIWITESSYTPIPDFQNLPGYQGGEDGFDRYIRDALTAQLRSEAEVVFWATLHDYPPETPDDFPYKHSGLYTYELQMKKGGQVFKQVAGECRLREHLYLPMVTGPGT